MYNWVHGYPRGHSRKFACVSCNSLEGSGDPVNVLKPFFRISSITELKRSGLSMERKLNRTATLWNSFKSSPSRRLLSSPTSGESCHFAVLRISLIWLALAPPTSSVSGFATSEASGESQYLQGAGNMLQTQFVLDSPLFQCKCSTQEADCPRL